MDILDYNASFQPPPPKAPRFTLRRLVILVIILGAIIVGSIKIYTTISHRSITGARIGIVRNENGVLISDQPLTSSDVKSVGQDPTAAPNGTGAKGKNDRGSGGVTQGQSSYIESKCFKFIVPKQNNLKGDGLACTASGSFDEGQTSFLGVDSVVEEFGTLNDAINLAKKFYQLQIISERYIKLGGLDAYEIIYNRDPTQPNAIPAAKIIVATNTKNYKDLSGKKITAFEINTTLEDSASKTILATLETSWGWK